MGTKFLPRARSDFQKAQEDFDQRGVKIQQLDAEAKEYSEQKANRTIVNKMKDRIVACVNDGGDCEKLPAVLQPQLKTIIAYLQLGNLNAPKMWIDEKKVLRNLDQFITRNNPSEASSSRNGEVQ